MPLENRRLVGTALVLLSAFAWSLNGLYTRFLTVDVWTTLTGRGIATSRCCWPRCWSRSAAETRPPHRLQRRARRIVIVAGSLCMITFVAALFHTTVANVTVIYAISPLMAAVLARFLIGDRLVARTLVAFAVALAGIAIMVGASFGTDRLFGDFLALLMSATFAVVIVEMRRKPDIDNLTSSFLTSLLTVIALLAVRLARIGRRRSMRCVLFLFGFTSNVLGFFLFIAGVRRMPPAEAGLIATIEICSRRSGCGCSSPKTPARRRLSAARSSLAAVLFQISGSSGRGRGMVIAEGARRRG